MKNLYGGIEPRIHHGWLFLSALMLCFLAVLPLDAVHAAPKIRLLVLGDSLSAGHLLPADQAFPPVLQRALLAAGYDVEVVNAGVSGDTASGGLERLEWAIGEGVDAAIVELGANDMLRGMDPGVTNKALDEILKRLQARNVKVLLAGMLSAPTMGKDYTTQFEAIYPDLAQKYHVPLYPFFLKDVATVPELNLSDGMHPNKKGVETIAKTILPDVIALLKSVRQPD